MADPSSFDPVARLSGEMSVAGDRVRAVMQLLDEGNTVPFISRYRKEATGGLDDATIHGLSERRGYLKELHERQQTILKSIDQQGQLTDELRRRLDSCTTKSELEDLYLPFKPRRRTRAAIARERGLDPLAQRILSQNDDDPHNAAAAFVDPENGVEDIDAALAGARDIVAEAAAENAVVRQYLREYFSKHGELLSKSVPDKTREATRFEQYYDFRELVRSIPSHRYLAIRRGEEEGVLRVRIEVDRQKVLPGVERRMLLAPRSRMAPMLREALEGLLQAVTGPIHRDRASR